MKVSKENLTSEQQEALNIAFTGQNILIMGGAGCGKSAVADLIVEELRNAGKKVVACAPTGAAAADRHGNTIHQIFEFPLKPCLTGKNLRPITRACNKLLDCDVLLIDEISMVRCDIMDSIYQSLKKLEERRKRKIQVICVGDMRQLCPPVNSKDDLMLAIAYEQNDGAYYPFMAQHWDDFGFHIIKLKTQLRTVNEEFACMLDRVGDGDGSKEVLDYFNSRIGENSEGIYLFNKNIKVRELNEARINGLETRTYETWVEYEDFPMEISKEIPRDLELAVGMPVMVTKNDTVSAKLGLPMKYFNGLAGVVAVLDYTSVIVDSNFGRVRIEPMIGVLKSGEYKTRYAQLPLVPAYALTIHKAQGKTIKIVNIDPTCDQPGQAYVALSRVRRIEDLYLLHAITANDIIQSKKVIEFLSFCEDKNHVFSWMVDKTFRNLESDIISVEQRLLGKKDQWLKEPTMVYIKRKRLLDNIYSTYGYDVGIKFCDLTIYITDYAQKLLLPGNGVRSSRHDYSNEVDILIRLLNFLIRSPKYSVGFTKQGLAYITPGMVGEYYDRYSTNRLPKRRKKLPGSQAQLKEQACLNNILRNLNRWFHPDRYFG